MYRVTIVLCTAALSAFCLGCGKGKGKAVSVIGSTSVQPFAEMLAEEFNKRQKVEEIVEAIRVFHEHGIMIHGMFVLGSESDSAAAVSRSRCSGK